MSKAYPCVYCTDDLKCTKFTDDEATSFCVLGPCKEETPSKADRIRAMTDNELAEWLADTDACPADISTPYCLKQDCNQCWLKWLKKEADDAD